ncbi:MAG: efflux RND transporter periplasmic adaptor subunit [Patescibacteria group bacterium]
MSDTMQQAPAMPKKHRFTFLKKRWFWIGAVAVLLIGGWAWAGQQGNKGPFYETRVVERGSVVQTVEITGEIKPDARLNLAFSSTAPFERVYKRVGQAVKRGDVIAELEARDLRFAAERARATLAIAQANLNAKLAGATEQSIRIAKASVDQPRASYDKTVVDLEVARLTVADEFEKAKLALDLAELNRTNSGATAEQAVVTSFETLRATLQTALGPMRNGLTDGDNIIGIDDSASNDDYENILGIFDRASLEEAKRLYPGTKAAVNEAAAAVRALSNASEQGAILDVALKTRSALEQVQLYLTFVQKTLAGTITNANLTAAELDAYKSGIGVDITSVGSQLSSVVSAYEGTRNSDLTRQTTIDQLENAYKTAKLNLQIAESEHTTKLKTAEANVEIQRAALEFANATLAEREAPPREVDVAGLRAQVLDAQTAYQQARERLADVQIIAPVDGVVTDIVPNIGEQVTANVTAVKMVSTEGYTVEALVPEADIAKIEAGQSIEITLDAFGDDVKFKGAVVSENPDQTKVSDAIYYKVYATIEAQDRDIKPGMTANLIVKTGERENALIVPTRALRDRDGQRYVRLLKNKSVSEADVELGLRGDEGRTEVVKGLSDSQIVIISEVSADEFGKLEADAKVGN